jgi:hypothetical protein
LSRQVERVIGMEKGFSNPFALDHAAKFGLSPNPGAARVSPQARANRTDVRQAPQRAYGYQSRQVQGGSAGNTAHNAAYGKTHSMTHDAVQKHQPAVHARETVAFGTGIAGSGAASVGRTQSGPSMAGDIKHGTAMSGGSVQAGANAARRTSGKSHRDKDGRAGSKTVSRYAMDKELFSSEDDLLRGFIMSEVLGKPKCLRRGGGRL